MKRVSFILLILFTFLCISCQNAQDKVEKRFLSSDSLRAWQNPTWALRGTTIRRQIKDLCWKEGTKMYADTIVTRYYKNEQPLIWVSEWGVNSQADSLLVWLQNNAFVGLNKSAFHYNEITGNLKKIRTLNFSKGEKANTLWANTEFYLTSAYIRLACGLRFGFLNIFFKYVEEIKPDYIAAAFDVSAPTFRHKMFDGYKATRHKMPDELREQIPVLKELLDACGILRLERPGYEADDILGTLAKKSEAEGMAVSLVFSKTVRRLKTLPLKTLQLKRIWIHLLST